MKFYLIKVYDMDNGEELIGSGYTSMSDCMWFFKEMENHYKRELDYKIIEVDL